MDGPEMLLWPRLIFPKNSQKQRREAERPFLRLGGV
jgi:hypothetical protein